MKPIDNTTKIYYPKKGDVIELARKNLHWGGNNLRYLIVNTSPCSRNFGSRCRSDGECRYCIELKNLQTEMIDHHCFKNAEGVDWWAFTGVTHETN